MDHIFRHFGFHRPFVDEREFWEDFSGDFPDQTPMTEDFDSLITRPRGIFEHFERQMDNMFRDFGIFDFPRSSVQDLPSLEPHIPENPSLRDQLLKESDSAQEPKRHRRTFPSFNDSYQKQVTPYEPHKKEDTDLDSEIQNKGLNSIVDPKMPTYGSILPRSFFSSSSTTVIRGSNGKVEEKHIVEDSHGNKKQTITRRLGDKVHSITTHENHQGEIEHQEDFVNVNENNMKEFEKHWASPRLFDEPSPRQQLLHQYENPENRSIFHRLFKNIISSNPDK